MIEEFTLPRGSEAEKRWLETTGYGLRAIIAESNRVLESAGVEDAIGRLEAVQRDMARRISEEMVGCTGNIVEQAMLTAMLAGTLIATTYGIIDYANGQAEILELGGEL